MKTISLNGEWEIHWSTGQRGGSPYVYHGLDNSDINSELKGLPRKLEGEYKPAGWIPATVPGEVHLDLLKAGIIENPNYGINAFKARFVEELVWYYRRTFDLPCDFQGEEIFLCFERLDLNAIVYLNGEEIARHSNVFFPLRVKIDKPLKKTGNELIVRIESGLFGVCDKPVINEPTATNDIGVLLNKRMWMRKPQYETEWDWSPRLINVGICGDVSLKTDNDVIVEDWQIRQNLSDDLLLAKVTSRVFIKNFNNKECCLEMKINGTTYKTLCNSNEISVDAEIADPRLWYPRGYGSPELYDVELRLLCEDKEVWSKKSHIGFRKVTVDQSPHPEKGHYFIICINNIKTFFKGANFVPASLFPYAVSKEDYEKIVNRAMEANFNMLRIWGGGIYESDYLYELCDQNGIMLWQEFISACAYPPVEKDEKLYQDMLDEAVYQVRRLSKHPSLVVWCGNNELNPYGHDIYMKDYPEIIKREDPEKYYQPASPYTDKNLEFASKEGNWSYIAGDQHPWEIGFAEKDHRKYRQMDCRFPNEGGVLGPTNLKVMEQISQSENTRVNTFSLESHDNSLAFSNVKSSPDENLRFWTKKLPDQVSVEEYLAAGGFIQGEGYSEYIDNFRRRAFSSSSAIFWMFNDCWPCYRSWTIIDNEFRKNMSFYHVKRAFNEIRIAFSYENGKLKILGINDNESTLDAVLRYGTFKSHGKDIKQKETSVKLGGRQITQLAEIDYNGETDMQLIPFAMLLNREGKLITRNRFLCGRYYEYTLDPENIKIKVEGDETVFLSDTYVMGVCIDTQGEENISDNLFDLYPGIPYVVKTNGKNKVITSLNKILAK